MQGRGSAEWGSLFMVDAPSAGSAELPWRDSPARVCDVLVTTSWGFPLLVNQGRRTEDLLSVQRIARDEYPPGKDRSSERSILRLLRPAELCWKLNSLQHPTCFIEETRNDLEIQLFGHVFVFIQAQA